MWPLIYYEGNQFYRMTIPPHVTAKNLDNVIRVTYFYGFQIIKWSCNYEYQWFWNEKHWIRKTTWDKVSCKLKFKSSLSGIIETAGNYWNALSSATKFMSLAKYCLLVRMFHWRTINKIYHLREKCLRSIYNDKTSAFKELLETTGSISTGKYSRNL